MTSELRSVAAMAAFSDGRPMALSSGDAEAPAVASGDGEPMAVLTDGKAMVFSDGERIFTWPRPANLATLSVVGDCIHGDSSRLGLSGAVRAATSAVAMTTFSAKDGIDSFPATEALEAFSDREAMAAFSDKDAVRAFPGGVKTIVLMSEYGEAMEAFSAECGG